VTLSIRTLTFSDSLRSSVRSSTCPAYR
jgi:hypothetical protein